jgi:hypothetical protein
MFSVSGGEVRLLPLPEDQMEFPEADPWEELWRGYCQPISGKSRARPALQRQFMPRRYWKYLPERTWCLTARQKLCVQASIRAVFLLYWLMLFLKKYCRAILEAALVLTFILSCASTVPVNQAAPAEEESVPLLPLREGWYAYDFERTFKSIENEYSFTLSTGMKMVQEVTYRYTGVAARYEQDTLFDPVMEIALRINSGGIITCAENPSIQGSLGTDGVFFWGGLTEEHGSLTAVYVRGTLRPLPPQARGGPEFDGIYHMTDSGTGREQLAHVSEGFYTWRYLDGEAAGFTPWPALILPGGNFSFGLEITTVLVMGEFSQANYSTGFSVQGTITSGAGISLEEFSRTVGTGEDRHGAPQVYAGTVIRAGEYPNEAIPQDIESLVRSGKAAIQASPKPDLSQYPSWYLNPPVKAGYLYASGEKTFDNRETALALAEAAAAANIAEQLRIRIEAQEREQSTGTEGRFESLIKTGALERLPYRIAEQRYDSGTRRAFVLAELALE